MRLKTWPWKYGETLCIPTLHPSVSLPFSQCALAQLSHKAAAGFCRKLIRSVPTKERIRLLRIMGSSDIVQLWNVAADLYNTTAQQRMAALGPDSLADQDFPQAYEDVRCARICCCHRLWHSPQLEPTCC